MTPELEMQLFTETQQRIQARFQSDCVEQQADQAGWIRDRLDYAKRAYQERPNIDTERRLGALVAFGEEKGLLPENYHRTLPF